MNPNGTHSLRQAAAPAAQFNHSLEENVLRGWPVKMTWFIVGAPEELSCRLLRVAQYNRSAHQR